MTHVEAVQHALLHHLRVHLPAVGGHVYLSPQTQTHVPLVPVGFLSRRGNDKGRCHDARDDKASVWLHGPSWRRNPWAACVPDPVVRQGDTFTRYHSPPACDLLYDVLVLCRSAVGVLTAATQLCACVAHHGTIRAPLMNDENESAMNQESHHSHAEYELCWDSDMLTRDLVNTSGWHALSGRLCVRGVLVDGMVVANDSRTSIHFGIALHSHCRNHLDMESGEETSIRSMPLGL
ncbi:MAG: hypothetical protein AAF471_05040 [Myxococcota bacterium]